MSDYIKREDVKHVVNKSKYYGQKVWYDILEYVYDIPSADVAPVRHGRWNKGVCSVCNKFSGFDDDNYCPYCGAKMDAKADSFTGK